MKKKRLTKEIIADWLKSDLDLEQFAKKLGLRNKYSITNYCTKIKIKIPKEKWNKKQAINHFAIIKDKEVGMCEYWDKHNKKFKLEIYSSNLKTKEEVKWILQRNNVKFRIRKPRKKSHHHWNILCSFNKSEFKNIKLLLEEHVKVVEPRRNSSIPPTDKSVGILEATL